MASDIKMIWDSENITADMLFQNGDLLREEGLETAVLMSLFSDRRAEEKDEIDNKNDRRGWWGDQTAGLTDQIGSRLWIIERAKTTSQTVVLAKQYVKEALQWMLDDGVASKINVMTERFGNPGEDKLGITIEIYKINGQIEVFEFDDLWTAQFAEA